jgi:histidine triad (HIT) family protein
MDELDKAQTKLLEQEEPLEKSRGVRARREGECQFCAIAKNQASISVVFRDSVSVAFLDKRPIFFGHCLLIPNKHYETLSDLPKELVGPFFTNAQLLTKAVQNGVQAEGTFVAINNKVSQSVPHLHIHVVPRRFGDGLKGFFWPRHSYQSEEQMIEIRNSIRAAIEKIQLSADS